MSDYVFPVKRNLCVRTATVRPGRETTNPNGFIRCKTIPPVRTLDDAKKIAYRMISKLDRAETVSIRLSPKGREEKGTRYYFRKQHGRVVCSVGSEFGGKRCPGE